MIITFLIHLTPKHNWIFLACTKLYINRRIILEEAKLHDHPVYRESNRATFLSKTIEYHSHLVAAKPSVEVQEMLY